MISEATEMSKPVCRDMPFSVAALPTSISRRNLSLTSITRFQATRSGSMSSRANLGEKAMDAQSELLKDNLQHARGMAMGAQSDRLEWHMQDALLDMLH